MRQGHNNNNNNNNNNKRMRGRSRKGPNPLQRSFESNGPDVKIRGTAMHIAEKYVMLARDAASSGDRVAEQNYLQHAEHYYRIVAAAQAQMPQQQPFQRPEEFEDEDDLDGGGYDRPQQGDSRQQFGVGDPQPYVNGAPFNGQNAGQDGEGEGDFDGGQNEQQPPRRPQQQNEFRQNSNYGGQRDNYRQDRQQGEYRGQGNQGGGQGEYRGQRNQGGQGEYRGQGDNRPQGDNRQRSEGRPQGEPRQQGESRPQGEGRPQGEARPQGEYRQQEFRQEDFRQPAPPQGEPVVQAEARPQGEPRPEGAPVDAATPAGETPRFRSRGRRSGRGRPRPEGGEMAPLGDAAGAPQPAAVQAQPAPAPVSDE